MTHLAHAYVGRVTVLVAASVGTRAFAESRAAFVGDGNGKAGEADA